MGTPLASGSYDRTIRLWDVHTGEHKKILTGHTDNIYSVVFSPDGQILASGSEDGTVRLWDTHTGEHKQTLTGHIGAVYDVAFSSDGQTLASGGGKAVRLWDAHTGEHKQTLTGYTEQVSSVAFSPDGKTLASGSDPGEIVGLLGWRHGCSQKNAHWRYRTSFQCSVQPRWKNTRRWDR